MRMIFRSCTAGFFGATNRFRLIYGSQAEIMRSFGFDRHPESQFSFTPCGRLLICSADAAVLALEWSGRVFAAWRP